MRLIWVYFDEQRLALLVGALQMFASELHRAARTQDSGDWETAVGPTDEIGIQGMLRAVRGLAATLGASAPAVAAVHTHRYAPGNNMVISGSFGSTTGRFASTPISQLSWILLCSTTVLNLRLQHHNQPPAHKPSFLISCSCS